MLTWSAVIHYYYLILCTTILCIPSICADSLRWWPAGLDRRPWCRGSTWSWWWGTDDRKCSCIQTLSSPPQDPPAGPEHHKTNSWCINLHTTVNLLNSDARVSDSCQTRTHKQDTNNSLVSYFKVSQQNTYLCQSNIFVIYCGCHPCSSASIMLL